MSQYATPLSGVAYFCNGYRTATIKAQIVELVVLEQLYDLVIRIEYNVGLI